MKKKTQVVAASIGVAMINLAATIAFIGSGSWLAVLAAILTAMCVYVFYDVTRKNQPAPAGATWRNEMKNIGWGKLVLSLLLFASITVFVAEALFRDYVFDPGLGAFGAQINPLVYVVALAFLAYQSQNWLSQASGGRRILDNVVSVVMLVVVVVAVAIWTKFPIVQTVMTSTSTWIGYPIKSDPDPYKLAVAVIFGALALWDVLGRDIFGIGRRSHTEAGLGLSGIRREDLVSGAHGDLPDRTEELASRSGSPLYRATGDAVMELNWWVRHPGTGELIPVKNVPPRLSIRAIEHIASEPPPPAPPPSAS